MSITKKTGAILLIMLLCMTAAVYSVSRTMLLDAFVEVENRNTQSHVGRVEEALKADLSALVKMTGDWSNWDDVYEFVLDGNEEFVSTNVQGKAFKQMDVDVMVFLNLEGQELLSAAFSRKTGEPVAVPTGLVDILRPGSLLLRPNESDEPVSGVLNLPDGPVMVAARPILTSEYVGPSRGTLVMAKLLNDEVDRQLAETTHLKLALAPVDSVALGVAERVALAGLLKDGTAFVKPLSDQQVMGYGLVRDVFGRPAVLISVDLPRPVYAQGLVTINYFLLVLGVISAFTLFTTLLLLRRLVLRRLARLSSEVSAIGASSDFRRRVSPSGSDELGGFASTLNRTLDALHEAEGQLRISEARQRAVVAALPDAMVTFKRDGTVLTAKADGENRLGELYRDLAGSTLSASLPHDLAEKTEESLARAVASGQPDSFEFQLQTAGGEDNRTYEARVVTSGSDEALAIVRDVTERRQLEDAHRKELLLREIHHRVKNNLQVISSLLSLQADNAGDPELTEMLRESQNRVRTMALIHEKLYKSRDMDGVNFGEYLRDLVAFLMNSYRLGRTDTSIEVDAQDVQLGLDKAVPCGLIVNELVSNAFKYAFPSGRAGKLLVRFAPDPDGRVQLVVADDGVGLPKGFDLYGTDSLGMRLVRSLSDQLDASLEVKNGVGTAFKLDFAAR